MVGARDEKMAVLLKKGQHEVPQSAVPWDAESCGGADEHLVHVEDIGAQAIHGE
jgi:hypothetical protein